MNTPADNAAAIIGVGAILPDAPDADAFWRNIRGAHYSITDVDAERWDPALYYDPDPQAAEKTYSKIGGWVREWDWNPLAWKLPIPPRVGDAMDHAQKWGVACTRMALADAGWPERPLDLDRTGVMLGNALSGEQHYRTALRITFPELARELDKTHSFALLPSDARDAIKRELHADFADWLPEITEDTMPGELSNCLAGRVANLFNLHGPNFTVDAACASAMAAMSVAIEGLVAGDYDAVVTGGVDRNMGASTFVKFCAIGALSGTGTRPYADGADGFVMGEGGAVFVLKRLADAERDGDRIYAVVRGIGGASDGKGKGITAPNPVGQKLSVERAWRNAGLSPAACTLIEGHGTSTRVGDAVELNSLAEAFASAGLARGSVALGSVKSNIGHLKAAAGAAGILKTAFALRDKVLPPSLNFERPNPNLDWSSSPFAVNTETRDWEVADGATRVAGVSAFGFGGTNFHVVMEEYVPGHLTTNGHHRSVSVPVDIPAEPAGPKAPPRGALVLGAADEASLANELRTELAEARQGRHLDPAAPSAAALHAPERIAIDYADGDDLIAKAETALKALQSGNPAVWPALRARGIHRGSGDAGKVAFLYTGQGSQYAGMLRDLREREPVVADTFDEADRIMAPLLEGRRLSDIVFDAPDAEEQLRRTEITQPAVLTVDIALTRLLSQYGIAPDMVMGHSLGEYGALVAAGSLTFEAALEAVSARGREMADLDPEDPGAMAAVMAPLSDVEEVVAATDGYVVLANVNSTHQVVLGGATEAVGRAVAALKERGHDAFPLPVSHAFHTEIVAGASVPLRATLQRLGLRAPQLPIVANVDGEFYPTDGDVSEQMLDILARQVASPVQFVKGLRTLYEAGARVFVETGPKRALQGFASDVLGDDKVLSLATNHPKAGDIATFSSALCGLWAAGLGTGVETPAASVAALQPGATAQAAPAPPAPPVPPAPPAPPASSGDLSRLFDEFVERARALTGAAEPSGERDTEPVVITGAGLGLPGAEKLFDDSNLGRFLDGKQGIDVIPARLRREMVDKHITRLVKGDDGSARFETIDDVENVIKLAARAGEFDLGEEFGVDADRIAALGRATQLAMAAGIEALRDAGIPLVQRYRTTSKGTQLPDRWSLPDTLRDDTGIIFASAFPGLEEMADEVTRATEDRMRRERLAALESLRARMLDHGDTDKIVLEEVERRIYDVSRQIEDHKYEFDRRFLFRVLSMGHSQLAEHIGARGPNTQVNSACASTTQAVAIAEDWIRAGRCRRVVIVAADDATSDTMMGWLGAGFLASGAAATDEVVENAALPFDQRRHGMIIGMGAAALVVESAEVARERGITPICEVLGSVTANSAFHGTRLDVEHIGGVMENVIAQAERRGVSRHEIAPQTVFVSHETYTPARGGSAAAEIHALRQVFGTDADAIVIANTKGMTGHPMGVGLEDVMAVKSLETGVVPPVPNFRDVDPELGELHLSHGGAYPVHYALRLAAGFGSQISMLLLRWTPPADGRRRHVDELGYTYRVADRAKWAAWLRAVSGQADPRLEIVRRTLRVADGVPAHVPPPPAPEPEPITAAELVTPAAPAPEPVAAAPEPEPVAATPEPVASGDGVEARVLAIVAEQTGYPEDLLDMDLDLEADLGIDTVKQAEVFATIREAYGIERDDSLNLRDYATLNAVVGFVRDRAPQIAAAAAAESPAPSQAAPAPAQAVPAPAPAVPAPAPAAPTPSPALDEVESRVLAIVAEQTGYPPELLDMDLDLEADLGIDTVKQAEVFATIREAYGIERDDSLNLRDYATLNAVVGFVRDRAPQAAPAAAPVAEPAPPPAEAPAPAAEPAELDAIEAKVLAIVSDQTGYPSELLDMDLDLEADLGIDTVKQAEVFATIREAYGIERDDSLNLRDYPTLNAVVGFVKERAETAPVAETPPAAQTAPEAQADDAEFPRRVPVPVLRPPLDRCVGTGVTLAEGMRVLVVPDSTGVAAALTKRLKKLGVEIVDSGPVDGVYWLAALDPDPDAADWRAGLAARVKRLAETMREQPATTFLVSATRLGGRHGYDADGAQTVLGGAVTGFTKAFARERPDALVKAVDFPVDRRTAALADVLIEETLKDPGAVEIGHADELRWTVGLEERATTQDEAESLKADDVFLITGAAGSIVSAIAADLATASQGTFHLLDLVPAPDPDDPDVARFAADRDGLKRDIADRIRERGDKPTPKLVDKELARIERARAALDAMNAISQAGGTAHWHQVDLTDAAKVTEAVNAALATSGRIDVLIHAGGLEISHFLPDKPQQEFDLVFDVKADGWHHILTALGDAKPRAAVVFSSIAGRFGNGGQTDYSAANDLLCKAISNLRAQGVKAIAIDWTAWAQIGMASRGSIPTVMKAAGIDMLPPEHGIPVVRRELTAAGDGAEVLVAGALGVLAEERHPTGGLDVDATSGGPVGPMTGRVESVTADGELRMVTELDPATQPFLYDHRIDGTPVLPGVMGIEGFAEAAHVLAPGWHVASVEDVELLAPFKFYRDEPRRLELSTRVADGGDGTLVADCRLVGRRTVKGAGEQETLHFTGRARLTREAPAAPTGETPTAMEDGVDREAVYKVYFHGPAYQVLERAWRDNGLVVGAFADDLPADHEPVERATEFVPRLIELCFQTAGVFELGTEGRLALPTHVDRVTRFAGADEPGRLYAMVTQRSDGVDADVVDEDGRVRIRLEGYRTTELPGGIDQDALAPIRAAMEKG
jgi:malonyl CoA-acyl carrier protein transacylase